MCGRYSLTSAPEAMRQLFDLDGPLLNLEPRYNIAPTQDAPVIRATESGGRDMAMLRWGLVPSWSKDGPDSGFSMFNARAETIADKPAFRGPFRDRRCLVPADGFYEWKTDGKEKQPFRFTMADGAPFLLAGLWDRWRRPDGSTLQSFTIIVTTPNRLVSQVHDRMPVIFDRAGAAQWLAGGSRSSMLALLVPFPAERMAASKVSKRVNNPANDDPSVIEPLTA